MKAHSCLEAVSPTPASGLARTQALAKTVTLLTLLFGLEIVSVFVLIKIAHNLALQCHEGCALLCPVNENICCEKQVISFIALPKKISIYDKIIDIIGELYNT